MSDEGKECVSCFNDLPNEIILMIYCYLPRLQIVNAFLGYNKRLEDCLSAYYQNINFTLFSTSEFDRYMVLLQRKHIYPWRLILNDTRYKRQSEFFFYVIDSEVSYNLDHIQHLSLLGCSLSRLNSICSNLSKFKSLISLTH